MTAPPFGPPPVPHAPRAPVQAPGGRRPPRLLVVAVAGLVAFLAAGAGAYLIARDHRTYQVTQSCGGHNCIPALRTAALVEALKGRGHTCKQEGREWFCDLMVGSVHFKVWVSDADGHIHRISAEVFHAEKEKVTKAGKTYLAWFAILPYRDDAAATAEIRNWLTEQLEAGKETKATILDYQYVLTTPKDGGVSLDIRAPS